MGELILAHNTGQIKYYSTLRTNDIYEYAVHSANKLLTALFSMFRIQWNIIALTLNTKQLKEIISDAKKKVFHYCCKL